MSVTRKLDSLREFPACKLTAEAYLEETLSADPNASLAGIKKLRVALGKHPPSLTHSQRTLARMILGLKSPNWNTTPPVKYPMRLNQFGSPETTAELIRYGSSVVELYGVAIQLVEETNPDVWGVCESSTKHAAQVAELQARQDEIERRADSAVSGDDLLISDDPTTPATFKASGGKIPLAPRKDASSRLVAFLMQQREQRENKD